MAALDHIVTKKTFEHIGENGNKGDDQNAKACEMAQNKGDGQADKPNETAVKYGGDEGFSTGTHGKIGGMDIGAEGHAAGINANQLGCQCPNFSSGIIDFREQTGDGKQNAG